MGNYFTIQVTALLKKEWFGKIKKNESGNPGTEPAQIAPLDFCGIFCGARFLRQ
jgi:hypothetical protein